MSLAERFAERRQNDRLREVGEQVQQRLVESVGPRLHDPNVESGEFADMINDQVRELIDEVDAPLSAQEKAELVGRVGDAVLGLGPLEAFVRDPEVTEIMVNGHDTIYVERRGKIFRTAARFADEGQLRRVIDKIVSKVGRRVDEASPYVDARLPDGSRVNVIIPPLAVRGAAMTIRKFAQDPYDVNDLMSFGTLPLPVAEFLSAAVVGRMNIVISGGTGAGKTTTLNMLSAFLPQDERIITIEDTAELKLQQPHVVSLESRPANIEDRGEVTVRDLVRNALRMRPDRIVVGEVRGPEALDMLQAMNTGHDGSLTTVHANSPRDALSRIETMTLMAGMDLTVRAIREQAASAINLIVHQARFRDGVRRITQVTEVVGMEGDIVTVQDLFTFDHPRMTLRPTGLRPRCLDRLADRNIHVHPDVFTADSAAYAGTEVAS